MKNPITVILVLIAATFLWLHHIGAPADMTCPPPDHFIGYWSFGGTPSQPSGVNWALNPEVHWLGWTEVGLCGQSVNVKAG